MAIDPLEQIFVKSEQIEGEQRAILAQLIFPYASINPETGDVHFKTTADDLNARQKILLFLLCRLALSTRQNATFSASVAPIEIEKATFLPGGTIRPKLLELVKMRVVIKDGQGYSVPATQLPRAVHIFPNNDQGQEV